MGVGADPTAAAAAATSTAVGMTKDGGSSPPPSLSQGTTSSPLLLPPTIIAPSSKPGRAPSRSATPPVVASDSVASNKNNATTTTSSSSSVNELDADVAALVRDAARIAAELEQKPELISSPPSFSEVKQGPSSFRSSTSVPSPPQSLSQQTSQTIPMSLLNSSVSHSPATARLSISSPQKPKTPLKWSTNNGTGGGSANSSFISAVAPLAINTGTAHSSTISPANVPATTLTAPSPVSVPAAQLTPLDEDEIAPSFSSPPLSAVLPGSSPMLATPLSSSASAPEPGRSKRMSTRSRSEGSDPVLNTGNSGKRLTRQRSTSDNFATTVKEVLVGTPVKEGHVNYMLMFDMLTGIRVSVSRCNAKPMKDTMSEEDFEAAHKLAFDVTGNELTPSSRYDFKFKDYAPFIFRSIRDSFHVDSTEYLLSLTGKYVLSELGSPGKSGSFFYFSQDYRFIIKTIHHSEHRFIRAILKRYYDHVVTNPQSLLSRIFGLHRVKLPGNRKIHFVVMGNVFPPNKDIHETYDLKGSTVGRIIKEDEMQKNPRAVLKDLNWVQKGRKLHLGPEKAGIFLEQLHTDVQFLVENKIMDYSLLVGLHDMVKGNADNIRDTTLAVFEPNAENITRHKRSSSIREPRRGSKASAMKRLLTESDPVKLGPSNSRLPEDLPTERKFSYFYKDMGGFSATDHDDSPFPEIYYLGVIDIFTRYDGAKKLEHFFKSLVANAKKISSVNPTLYGSRFLEFMTAAIAKPTDNPPPVSPLTSYPPGNP